MISLPPNDVSILALAAEYVPLSKKKFKILEKIIKSPYALDVFNALQGNKSSEDAKKIAKELKKWAEGNQWDKLNKWIIKWEKQ